MPPERLLTSFSVIGDVPDLNREELKGRLQMVMAQVLSEFHLSLQDNKILIEDDLFAAAFDATNNMKNEMTWESSLLSQSNSHP